jgi:hypothetical protein
VDAVPREASGFAGGNAVLDKTAMVIAFALLAVFHRLALPGTLFCNLCSAYAFAPPAVANRSPGPGSNPLGW